MRDRYSELDQDLIDIGKLLPDDGNFIVGDGTKWVAESGNTARTSLGLGTGDSPTFTGGTFTGVLSVEGIGDGGRTNYDFKVGDTATPDYGMIQFGNAVIGRTSYKVGDIDLDGSILIQNIGGPVTSQVEFCFAVSTGSSTRFALAKAGVGNATYNSRSMLIAGPAPANTDFVTVGYWQTNNNIFDNLACNTDGSGADLGVQNDLEVEGDIFVDSIKESTTDAGITFNANLIIESDIGIATDLDLIQLTGANTAKVNGTLEVTTSINTLTINLTTNTGLITVDGTTFLANDGTGNVFLGADVFDNDTGQFNVGMGFNAGLNNDTTGAGAEGDFNVYIGYQAGAGLTSSTNNTGYYNAGVGYRFLAVNTTGNKNIGMGYRVLEDNTIGRGNLGFGYLTLSNNTEGEENVGIGAEALLKNTTGDNNVGLGKNSLTANTIGRENTGVGHNAIFSNTSGDRNVGIGSTALTFSQTGDDNVAIGYRAGRGASGNSYSFNTFIGSRAGYTIETGSSNVFVGRESGYNQTTTSNLLIIDNQNRSSAGNEAIQSLIYGTFNATVASQILAINAGTFTLNAGVDTDMVVNFTGTTNSGVLTWMEDEDYFKFSDDVVFDDAEFLVFDKASGNGIKVDTTTPTFGFADLLGDVTVKNTGGTRPALIAYRDGLLDFEFAAGEEEYFKYHIPHDYVKGTDIFIHYHWSTNGALVNGGTLTFDYEISYAKAHAQAAFPASVSGTVVSATASSTQYTQELTEVQISASSPSGSQIDTDDLEPDGVIICTAGLNANNLTVSSGGVPDPFIHYIDIHYQTTGLIGTKAKAPDFYA